MKVVLDTNCFIDAMNPSAHAHEGMTIILAAHVSRRITIMVSRHTLAELALKPDSASLLANTFNVIPHWPIGAIAEQVATIEQLAGTWEDARRNEEIQRELESLAKSGNDIRDRGALLDALYEKADAFITSDRQLVGTGPARRIWERFGLWVLKPSEFADEVSRPLR